MALNTLPYAEILDSVGSQSQYDDRIVLPELGRGEADVSQYRHERPNESHLSLPPHQLTFPGQTRSGLDFYPSEKGADLKLRDPIELQVPLDRASGLGVGTSDATLSSNLCELAVPTSRVEKSHGQATVVSLSRAGLRTLNELDSGYISRNHTRDARYGQDKTIDNGKGQHISGNITGWPELALSEVGSAHMEAQTGHMLQGGVLGSGAIPKKHITPKQEKVRASADVFGQTYNPISTQRVGLQAEFLGNSQGTVGVNQEILVNTPPQLQDLGLSPDFRSNEHPIYSTGWNQSSNRGNTFVKKAPTYDGTDSWKDHLVQFEMVCELNAWSHAPVVKAMELATSLRGQAQAVLSDLEPSERRSYEHLVQALTTRFEPENQSELYRAQLKNRLRKKNEALAELAQDIKKLVRKTYPHSSVSMRDNLALDCFLDSLNDSNMEWEIFKGQPKSLQIAVKLGLEYEAFQTGRRRPLTHPDGRWTVRMQNEEPFDKQSETADPILQSILVRLANMENCI